MKLKRTTLGAVILTVALASCRRENTPDSTFGDVNSSEEMVVPDGFTFNTDRSVDFDIATCELWAKDKIRLDIYDFMPSAGGSRLLSQFMDGHGRAKGKLSLPATLKKVYVVVVTPDGSSSLAVVSADGPKISYDFNEKKMARKTQVVSPTCSSGCDQSINNQSGNLTINGNDASGVYCLTGNISGNINVNNGNVTIRICGTANLSNVSLNNGSHMEIVDGASVTANSININSASGSLTVYNASLTLHNSFSLGGIVMNYGSMNVGQNLNINGSAQMTNNGSLTVGNNLNNNKDLTNNGSLAIGNKFNINGGSTTINNCQIDVADDLTINNPLQNYGFIKVGDKLTVNGGGATTLHSGAMITAASATINNSITGLGTTSLVKVTGNTTLNGGGSLNGNMEYCDVNGVETNWGSINSPAALACNVYIPTSACNSVGHGTPQIVDSDNDGVADDADLYPNDPNASGATFYPADQSFATLAFEDLWPNMGDYDFNDLVVNYRHRMVTNSNNEVIRIESDFVTIAIGGSFNKGFALQFDLLPSDISSVTGQQFNTTELSISGNGTEAGQSKAVVFVFDNAFKTVPGVGGTKFVNTDPTEAGKQRDTLRTVVTLTGPKPLEALGNAPFNPFIYINHDRGKELHLLDNPATDLVNTSFFGQGGDNSNPGANRFYKTENNLPWALNVVGGFAYPAEKVDIVEAYNYFDIWAQSGGTSNMDWAEDFPGYRDAAKVY